MLRSLIIAGLGFAVMVIATGAIMLHPTPETLLAALVPSAHKLAILTSAMTFAVAAVIEDR